MKIIDRHQAHGAALVQIIEDDAFTALNKVTDHQGRHKQGHYQVNNDCRLLIKKANDNGGKWRFTLTTNDLPVIAQDLDHGHRFFLCLVCDGETVCLLNENDLREVVDLDSGTSRTIVVHTPARKSMRVHGSDGDLDRKVPHSDFPNAIF